MISIQDKKECCGCSACAQRCPKQCITMQPDSEGFLYPNVDTTVCINCHLCEKVCNELHPFDKRTPLRVLAAVNKNDSVRKRSSSGGTFYILAEKIINDGGVVFGARFDENWQVIIDYAEDMNGVEAFMGSKYVQARMENAYKDVKRFLTAGKKVLFSGTPCQVAGLHKYLNKPYENLFSVDFICHGTPSPKVWSKYLDVVIKGIERISSVDFRNKKNGWKNYNFRITYDKDSNTISLSSVFTKNHYMKAFLQDLILRPSCYDCKARECSSQSDITIADFWGVNAIFPKMDDDKGTSLVFINTDKGEAILDFNKLKIAETTYERIKPFNPACYCSPKVNPKRHDFFSRLEYENVLDLIIDCTRLSVKQSLLKYINNCKYLLWRSLKSVMRGG